MRILLTGVSGQIGHALLAQLQTRGEIIRADRRLLDLTRPDLIPGVLDTLKPDLIVNPAAYTDVDRAETDFGFGVSGQCNISRRSGAVGNR